MKINPLIILLDNKFKPDKKFYLISGNEITLMEKIKSLIILKYQQEEKCEIKNIDTIKDFVDQEGLFENKKIFIGKDCKGINEESLNKAKKSNGVFVFIQENSQSSKKIKGFFVKDKDSYSVDCYELDRVSRIKILNKFINVNKLSISEEIYWMLVDKLDNRFIFFENSLKKILDLDNIDITTNNIKKILTIDESGKEKIFFNLFKKNKDIVELYRNKILTESDVNSLYYSCKFFCQLIIDCNSEGEYLKKIPIYLFKEKNYLIDLFRRYNSSKKKLLIKLLSSTESILRKESNLSLVSGLRFILNIKKITIS